MAPILKVKYDIKAFDSFAFHVCFNFKFFHASSLEKKGIQMALKMFQRELEPMCRLRCFVERLPCSWLQGTADWPHIRKCAKSWTFWITYDKLFDSLSCIETQGKKQQKMFVCFITYDFKVCVLSLFMTLIYLKQHACISVKQHGCN